MMEKRMYTRVWSWISELLSPSWVQCLWAVEVVLGYQLKRMVVGLVVELVQPSADASIFSGDGRSFVRDALSARRSHATCEDQFLRTIILDPSVRPAFCADRLQFPPAPSSNFRVLNQSASGKSWQLPIQIVLNLLNGFAEQIKYTQISSYDLIHRVIVVSPHYSISPLPKHTAGSGFSSHVGSTEKFYLPQFPVLGLLPRFPWASQKLQESRGKRGHSIERDFSQPHLVKFLAVSNNDFVSCGEYHTCAVPTSSDLFTWGDDIHNAGLLDYRLQIHGHPFALLLLAIASVHGENCHENSLSDFHECCIRFGEYVSIEFMRLPCQHFFCGKCIETYADLHVKEGTINKFLYPTTECGGLVLPRLLRRLLGDEEVEQWKFVMLQKTP
ncbi:hypothetical protein Nepgr_014941 [Nepenthes gracilis]|uniref:RING-type domain-containing protein n=1 Tax=Nepenthes gracilis TaxID=150966 RepID=A0AAD3SK62_NEPGR|nr:hypothetical protein Nepgr_014941 [Nepenthes gracilis]